MAVPASSPKAYSYTRWHPIKQDALVEGIKYNLKISIAILENQ